MPKTRLFHSVGLGIYRHRWHLAITFLVVLLPFLFVLFIVPLSHDEKQVFVEGLATSTIRLIIAYVISVGIALLLALLARGKLGIFFLPFFDVMQSLPTFALLPLAIHWFGASNTTVIMFLIFTIIWPMLFAIISSQKLIREDWEEAATIFGARNWRKLVYFVLPISYPGLVTGSVVGLGEGWEAVVGAEIIVGVQNSGLGSFFSANGESSRLVLFGVLALLLFIFSLNKIVWLPLLEKSHKLLTE